MEATARFNEARYRSSPIGSRRSQPGRHAATTSGSISRFQTVVADAAKEYDAARCMAYCVWMRRSCLVSVFIGLFTATLSAQSSSAPRDGRDDPDRLYA